MSAPPQQPDMNNATGLTVEKLFHYTPSQSTAIAFVVIFFAVAMVQFFLWWKHRPDGFMLVLAFTALIGESLGYIVRIIAMHNPTKGVFIVTTLLILLSPCATALVNYIVCGRVLAFTGQNVGCLRPNWISKAFLISDVVTFLVQGMGGALMISDNTTVINLGKSIVTAGLAVQIASFCLFIYVALSVQFMKRYGFHENRSAHNIFWGIHATMVCFIVRTVYRMIEFNAGVTGYASTHEWTFYAFDAAFMLIAFLVYSWPPLHFGFNLNRLSAEAEEGKFDAAKPGQGDVGMSTTAVTAFERV